MKDPEMDPELWKLLGQARRREASPYFVREVMRDVRRRSEEPVSWFQGLWSPLRLHRLSPLWVTASLALLALAAYVPLTRGPQVNGSAQTLWPLESLTEAFDPASEWATVEYLGKLMAVTDPGQLDDDALAALF